MATLSRRRVAKEPFQIHEDEPAELSDADADTQSQETTSQDHDQEQQPVEEPEGSEHVEEDEDDQENEHGGDDDEEQPEECDSDSSDENEPIDYTVQQDMEKLNIAFPDFKGNYRLIKRIGEGTCGCYTS
jgi:cell division control protein 7